MANKKVVLSAEAKTFIKVQTKARLVHRRISYADNIPDCKDKVLSKVVELIDKPVRDRVISLPPIWPVTEGDSDATENVSIDGLSVLDDFTVDELNAM